MPGSPIEIGGATGRRGRYGVTAIVKIDGALHLVTAGHNVGEGRPAVFLPGQRRPIARVTRNLLDGAPGQAIDGSVARLLQPGLRLLERVRADPRWTTHVASPHPAHVDCPAFCWPTHGDRLPAFESTISSWCADEYRLLHGSASRLLIQLPRCTELGDSGTPLYVGRGERGDWQQLAYLGLCTGAVGRFSYFTPVELILKRLRAQLGGEVYLWTP
ncbi:MAG: hypothetical protein KC636_03750 [Myxococcales bacterium]|nr:hypothetical protein [Myxococcales bacterium]